MVILSISIILVITHLYLFALFTVKSFQDRLANNVQRNIDLTNVEYQKTNQTRTLLEEKLSQLEAKLIRAREKLTALEQPVSFDYDSFEVMTNEDKGKTLIFTEVVVQFSYHYVPKGVLFFAENPDTGEKIVLQLDEEAVIFEIKNVDSVMRVKSPAILCPNCWFRVIATRCVYLITNYMVIYIWLPLFFMIVNCYGWCTIIIH